MTSAVSPSAASSSSRLQAQGQNPISLRLYKVLGANFDDDATREALDTLAELYAPRPAEGRAKDGKQETEADVDGEDDRDVNGARPTGLVASAGAGGVAGDMAARARKNLRRDVESKLAESSKQFLKAFGEVDKQLDTLQEHIGLMRVRCDEAQSQLHETNEACKSLLDRAGSLREERQGIAVRQSIISAFLSRFTLSSSEKEAISSRDVPLGPTFFAAMDKAARIQADCRVLLTASLTLPAPSLGGGEDEDGEDRATKAGRDILAATAAQLEQTYDKIFRWCCFEFRQMGKDASLDVSPTMREAVKRLRERPELLMEALTYLSQTRQATLLSSFMDALTRGGPGGLPRPIELHAHDPLRYVGDMLAWVHQAIAAEHEFLESLFGIRNARRMVGAERTFGASEEESWIAELLDGAVRGLCGPLRVRVQQTVRSQESSITSYKIANLVQFYMVTMQRTIGREALLSKTLEELTELAYSVFYGAIEAQGRSLLHVQLDPDDTGVSPPLAIMDHAQVLREMMVVYESSLLGNEQEEELQAGFRDILDKMVDPALEMTLTQAEEKKKQRPVWDKAVFVLNTLAYLQSVLEPYAFTTEKRGVIQGLVDAKVLQLIEEHYQDLLEDAGVAEVAAACEARAQNVSGLVNGSISEGCGRGREDGTETRSIQGPLSHVPAGEPAALQAALRRFSEWLSGAEVVQSRRLGLLTVQSVATRVHQAALERVAETYERICEEVKKPENKYEAAATLLGSERPFGQVRLLWQIFGLEGRGR
ncbi:oligomeric complex COG6 [Trametes coccinea BRFM310]|uniref:Conserved oligomeric Golgi complex subunit 6 n=1 Tax=Trametes coccinea (strain BRFM310) TaxID=1353009 RepID=A0A1Y2J522_TRAC3|nr:oligomeric complex COG6 [Trametes coccinea BRFM310]